MSKAPPKPKDQRTPEDEDEDDGEDVSDRLSTSDAYMFPIVSLEVADVRLVLMHAGRVSRAAWSIPHRKILGPGVD